MRIGRQLLAGPEATRENAERLLGLMEPGLRAALQVPDRDRDQVLATETHWVLQGVVANPAVVVQHVLGRLGSALLREERTGQILPSDSDWSAARRELIRHLQTH